MGSSSLTEIAIVLIMLHRPARGDKAPSMFSMRWAGICCVAVRTSTSRKGSKRECFFRTANLHQLSLWAIIAHEGSARPCLALGRGYSLEVRPDVAAMTWF